MSHNVVVTAVLPGCEDDFVGESWELEAQMMQNEARTTERDLDESLVADEGFSGTQTAKVVGISYRQLDYWARTDIIRPSLSDASGSGSRRRYSYLDLLELKTIKKLLDAGIKLEQVRKVFSYLREHVASDITAAHIVIDGRSVMLCEGDQLIDVLRNGQGVLNVLSLGGVREELEAALAPLSAEPEPERGADRHIG